MDWGIVSGVITGLLLLLFIGICLWAFSGKRKRDFEQAARLPLDDDDDNDMSENKS